MQAALLSHLTELRRRVLLCVAVYFAALVGCYFFAEYIYQFLAAPLADAFAGEARRMIYTSLTEAFTTYLRVAAWAALCITTPLLLTQLWRFVAPGLYEHEKRAFLPFLIATPVLFVAGAALAYFFVIPMAWQFFIGFEQAGSLDHLAIQLEARVADYLSLTMSLLFAFGVAFQLPIFLLLLVRFGVVTPAQLASKRRYAVIIIMVVAAVLTPPDVFSQLALAVPLLILFEGAILAARLIYGKKNLKEPQDD